MTRHGLNAVTFAEVAVAAGVTRQLVYNLFANRIALITEVLEDHVAELSERFKRADARVMPRSAGAGTRMFLDAACDTIEARGAGPWRLLSGRGGDPEIARIAQAMHHRLVDPWRRNIAQTLGIDDRDAATVLHLIVAAGEAVLDLWLAGSLTREEAVRDTTRGVTALLEAFSIRPRRAPRRPPRR